MKKQTPAKQNLSIASSAGSSSRARLWLFRLICVFVGPILFAGIWECGLRLLGWGYSTKAIVKCTLNGEEFCCHNYQFGWQFFPRRMARNFDGFVFKAEKPHKTCRIFVLGESAAMGMPAPAYNFGRILQVMLEELYPGVRFEVHTAAMVAINSHAVLKIAEECTRYNPDVLILYMGNNEVVGPYGPGTVFSPLLSSLGLIRANLAVKSTRTGQLLEQALDSAKFRNPAPSRWGGLGMFLGKQVRYDSPAMDYVYRHFEQNLTDICSIAGRRRIPVIISTVGANLKDCPPFASLHREDLTKAQLQEWETLYQEGIDYETAGQHQSAVEKYHAAEQIDPTFADLQFRLGRCYWLAGNFTAAKNHYRSAVEYDTLRFRADARINQIIRSAAEKFKQSGIVFVDGTAALEEHSPQQTPGGELFYEHVHLNFTGNYVLATALLPAVQQCLSGFPASSAGAVLSEQQAAERLAYTPFERHDFLNRLYQKMYSQPPFTNQLYHAEFMQTVQQQIRQLETMLQKAGISDCRRQYTQAMQRRPDDWQILWQYAVFAGTGLNDIKAQEEALRKVIRLCPYDAAYLSLGKNLHQQGKLKEAQEILRRLLDLKAGYDGKAHLELAMIYRQIADTSNYIKHLSKAIWFDPAGSIEAYGALAEAYEKSGELNKAVQTLYRAVAIFPRQQTAAAHATLGYMLNSQGNYEKALEEMKIALEINPAFAEDKLFKSLLSHIETRLSRRQKTND
ncbi:MAG TPA: tetratricopeptide repeat protein [Anaerohalosphaeraceae bacterium]|nr:tetratricopeptide repeat protein [Anaerohalosphaeraceae bacterium]